MKDRRLVPIAAFLVPMSRIYALSLRVPVLSRLCRCLARWICPPGSRIPVRVQAGLGKGLWLRIDPRYEMHYLDGSYEEEIQEGLAGHLGPGAVFYDVGAHLGVFSLIAARLVGEGGDVFAFEADPGNVCRIEEHVRGNTPLRVKVVPGIVWSQCGTLCFQRASEFSSRSMGAVTQVTPGLASEDFMPAPATTLDQFVRGSHRPPSLIKVDVEGAEAEVLKGAEEIFREARPILICEVHHQQASDVVQGWLRGMEYGVKCMTREARFPHHLLARPL
jgi:FkbM family methyltransferase